MALSRRKKILYPVGQFGLVLSSFAAIRYFSWFYVSLGQDSGYNFPELISRHYYFGFFTIIGIIIALGKLTDSVAGLLSGWLSDRGLSKWGSRLGRRSIFMAMAAFPLSVFSVLVFCPPFGYPHILNGVFVLLCFLFFCFFLSLYTMPYLGLLAEIGRSPRVRLQLSVLMACASAFATLVGNHIFGWMGFFGAVLHTSDVMTYRVVLILYGVISLVCMLVPVLSLNEPVETLAKPVPEPFRVSVRAVLKDSYFRHYLVSDVMYRFASAFIIAGLTYYVTGLLSLPTILINQLLLIIFFANMLLYIPVYGLVRIIGKRKILFAAFLLFLIFLGAAVFIGQYPLRPLTQAFLFAFLIAIPISIFSVVPNALIADLVVAAERKTGTYRSGIYFGIHSFVSKSAQLLSVAVFPLILSIGPRSGDVLKGAGMTGIRLTLVCAAVFSLTGFLFLFGYREKEVSALLEKNP